MARLVLLGGDGVSGETGLETRDKMNANFIELYASKHTRSHRLDSASDHATSLTDKGKFVKANDDTGASEYAFIADNDIPNTIARSADLQAHLEDFDNPHQVTAEQLNITGGTYEGGQAIAISEGIIAVLLQADGGLSVNDDNELYIKDPSGGGGLYRYYALSQGQEPGKEVSVLATGETVEADWANGNDLTLTIPTGIRVISISVRLSTYSSMTLTLSGDVTTLSASDHKWFPMMQAWRDDTQNQLTGAVLQGNSGNDFKFNITGLINTTNNFIRFTL